MTAFENELFASYQVRKTKKQKSAFRRFLMSRYAGGREEPGGNFGGVNVVFGDPDAAKIIFTAHYDTCARMPFPNFITPKNMLLTLLYGVLIAIPMLVLVIAVTAAGAALELSFPVVYFCELAVIFGFLYLMLAGPANKNTANDNTSGVVMLCRLLERLSPEVREKCAFVFFDNEELGLQGSAHFRKMHKSATENTLLVNFDCVSDGDHIMLILPKRARHLEERFSQAFASRPGKDVTVERAERTHYPSDQAKFPMGVGVAALKKSKIFGYYLDRIHTKRDTAWDEENLSLLLDGAAALAEKTASE